MTNRYVTRPIGLNWDHAWDQRYVLPLSMTVQDSTEDFKATGLLNNKGEPLYKTREQIGFPVTPKK